MESANLISELASLNPAWIAIAVLWTLAWKGFALWKAAGLGHRGWFVAMLFINTLGILEAVYLFIVARKYKVEIVEEN
jgi:hypothetical protein